MFFQAVHTLVVVLLGLVSATYSQETNKEQRVELTIVSAASDQPIPGATVTLIREGKEESLTADEHGRATIDPKINDEGYFGVFIQAPGYVKRMLQRGAFDKSSSVAKKVMLDEAITIGGKVIDDEGMPIDQARVLLTINMSSETQRAYELNYISFEKVLSKSDGTWSFSGAPKDFKTISVGVWSYDHASGSFFPFDSFSFDVAQQRKIQSTIPKGVPIQGTVFGKNGKPLQGAEVMFGADMASNKMDPQVTDEEGRFHFAAKQGETVTLTIKADDHAPDVQNFVMSNDVEEVEVLMQEASTMFGRIVGPDNEPIPKAWVFVDTWRGSRALETRLRADSEGCFRWNNAPKDAVQCAIDATSSGYMRESRSLTASEDEIVIELAKGLRVAGRVTDETTGQPIETFRIVRGTQHAPGRINWDEQSLVKSKEGRFSYTESWPAPAYAFRIEADGYFSSEQAGITRKEDWSEVEVQLTPGEPVQAKIVDTNGKPIPNANAYLVTPGSNVEFSNGNVYLQGSLKAVSKKDGSIQFAPQQKGFQIAVATEVGYVEVDDESLNENTTIEIQPWGTVSGTLDRDDDVAFQEIFLTVTTSTLRNKGHISHSFNTKTDEKGRFQFDKVPEGTGRICQMVRRVEQGNTLLDEALVQQIVIVAGDTTTVELIK